MNVMITLCRSERYEDVTVGELVVKVDDMRKTYRYVHHTNVGQMLFGRTTMPEGTYNGDIRCVPPHLDVLVCKFHRNAIRPIIPLRGLFELSNIENGIYMMDKLFNPVTKREYDQLMQFLYKADEIKIRIDKPMVVTRKKYFGEETIDWDEE